MREHRDGARRRVVEAGAALRAHRASAGAALLGLASLVEAVVRADDASTVPLALVLAAAVTAPVALGDARPAFAALLIMTTCSVMILGDGAVPLAGLGGLAWMMFLAGRRAPWRAVGLLGVLLAALLVAGATAAGSRTSIAGLAGAGVAVAAGAVGRVRAAGAVRDAQVRAMEDTLLDQVARGERARIARELHDVVAHHLSLITLEADAARLATVGMPVEGARRLQSISTTARTALSEMRRLLGVLRDDTATGPEPDRRPQPGLQQMNELLDTARASTGAGVRLIVQGRVRPLDPGVELTAYRIVQESLTNARRHAAGAAVDVELSYGGDGLRLLVRDSGPGGRPDRPDSGRPDGGRAGGHGLTGMRERAAMVGGQLEAGPTRHGGFVVRAFLPTGGDDR